MAFNGMYCLTIRQSFHKVWDLSTPIFVQVGKHFNYFCLAFLAADVFGV